VRKVHSFSSDGVEIAYIDEGEGEPIVLIHGFASTGSSPSIIVGMGAVRSSTVWRIMARR